MPWGVDGSNSRRAMGALPATGQWVKLAVPASLVGLEGKTVTGMAFTLYNGRAIWDKAGKTSAGTQTANYLTGLNIDERFRRTDNLGARDYLVDALGSTLALADSAGAIQTSYTYEPYGNTTVTGQANSNPYQYTGRERDGTGLYYYRARYYNPGLSRFVSEDPIGLAGGLNSHAYVGNNPLRFVDPLGLWTGQVGGSVNIKIGPFTASVGGGIAFDGQGNVAGYSEKGGGSSVGGDISGGLSIKGSNGDTIRDLNGPFVNVGSGGGWGPHASGDGFAGTGGRGQLVVGGGITIGFGAGGGSSVTITDTTVGNPMRTACQ